MLDQIIRHPWALARIRNCYLGSFLDTFAEYLHRKGYCPRSIHSYLESAEHFSHWLDGEDIAPQAVSKETVQVFLSNHLPACHCPMPAARSVRTMRAALHRLLPILQSDPRPSAADLTLTDIDMAIDQFDAYLKDVCGLAASTRYYRQRYVREFLTALFGSHELDVTQITSRSVICYVADHAHRYKPGSLGVLAGSLRSYFRFLQFNGQCDASLVAAAPKVPRWSLAGLPKTLSRAQLDNFLATFDRSTVTGLRDYAMARCMADLALRCSEVAGLQLDDLDWRRATLRLARGKSRHTDRLPLPSSLGKALVDYLCKARPQTQARSIFVYHRAPFGEGVTASTVRNAIRRGYARSGLTVAATGTHILRHTVATRMLYAGATLKEVADVLRHRSLDTTAIYTKVDLPHLSQVALPWPRRAS